MNTKYIIFGGCGFIGSNVALKLADEFGAHCVTVVDNISRLGVEHNLLDVQCAGIKVIRKDVVHTTYEDLCLNKNDKFVFLDFAANPAVTAGCEKGSVTELINDNFLGVGHIIELCKQCDSRLLFLSSSRIIPLVLLKSYKLNVYNQRFKPNDQAGEFDINSSLNGKKTFYGALKLSAEKLIEEAGFISGLNFKILRPGVIAGPRQMGASEQGFVSLWARNILQKKPIKYFGYQNFGYQVRDILHIDDIVSVIISICTADNFDSTSEFIGGGIPNSVSLCELTSLCEEISGETAIVEKCDTNEHVYDAPYIVIPQSTLLKNSVTNVKSTREIVTDTINYQRKLLQFNYFQ